MISLNIFTWSEIMTGSRLEMSNLSKSGPYELMWNRTIAFMNRLCDLDLRHTKNVQSSTLSSCAFDHSFDLKTRHTWTWANFFLLFSIVVLSMEIEDSAGYRRENSWKEASESFLCSLLSEEIISLLLFWHAFIVDRVLWGQPTLYGGLCSLWFMARLWSALSLRPARSRPCCTPPPASCRSPRHRSPRPRTWTWSLGQG